MWGWVGDVVMLMQALWGCGADSSATVWAGAGALLWRQALQFGVTHVWGGTCVGRCDLQA